MCVRACVRACVLAGGRVVSKRLTDATSGIGAPLRRASRGVLAAGARARAPKGKKWRFAIFEAKNK